MSLLFDLTERNDVLRVVYFPKGCAGIQCCEKNECWKQGKYDLLVSRSQSTIY